MGKYIFAAVIFATGVLCTVMVFVNANAGHIAGAVFMGVCAGVNFFITLPKILENK